MPTSFKIVFLGGVLLLVGLFMGINDLRMKLSAKQASATIMHIDQYLDSREFEVDYLWTDAESLEHSGHFRAPSTWTPPADMKLPIYYLAGRPETAATSNSFRLSGILMFLGGAALLLVGFVYFNNESVVQAHKDIERDNENGGWLKRRGVLALLRMFIGH